MSIRNVLKASTALTIEGIASLPPSEKLLTTFSGPIETVRRDLRDLSTVYRFAFVIATDDEQFARDAVKTFTKVWLAEDNGEPCADKTRT